MLARGLLLGAFAIAAFAQTEVEIFVGPVGLQASNVVSVVAVADCTTTFAVACTGGYYNAVSSSSIPCDPAVTVCVPF